MKNGAVVEELMIVSYQEAFEEEIKTFYEYVIKDIQPLTNAVDARKDISILQDILAAFHRKGWLEKLSDKLPGESS